MKTAKLSLRALAYHLIFNKRPRNSCSLTGDFLSSYMTIFALKLMMWLCMEFFLSLLRGYLNTETIYRLKLFKMLEVTSKITL